MKEGHDNCATLTDMERWQGELMEVARREKVADLMRFFKTKEGEYGAGDRFVGIYVPDNRRISRKYHSLSFGEIESMLDHEIHEFRLAGFLALVERYRKMKSDSEREATVDFYLRNGHKANNWDLVDLSTEYILGEELTAGRREQELWQLLESGNLWLERIGVVAMLTPIRAGMLDLPYAVAHRMLEHPHALMQKATGWILREAGKKDAPRLVRFLEDNAGRIPAITLSYAVEKFDVAERTRLRILRKEAQGRRRP